MTPLMTSVIAFAVIFGGTFLGMFVRNRLPKHHLSGETKEVVRLGTGLIGTIAALVLGLLISAANITYETQSTEIKQLIADVVLLDRTLALYGPETDPVRNLLRQDVSTMADPIGSGLRTVPGPGRRNRSWRTLRPNHSTMRS